MNSKSINAFNKLRKYCEKENFLGYDVGDGIDSWLIRKTYLGRIPMIRFIFLQLTGHRIAFVNFRPILFIKKKYNSKAIALFLNGYCNLYHIIDSINIDIERNECLKKINELGNLLISLRSKDYSGAGWGYPIIWQSINFSFPANTPTVVATSFAVEALLNAFEITKNITYRDIALSSVNFVKNDLKRYPLGDGYLFSYSPYKGNDTVINASLLGAKTLIMCYKYNSDVALLELAKSTVNACISLQNNDGSWHYGLQKRQKWIDNFHTGYVLDALNTYQEITKDTTFKNNIDKGLNFFINNFFEKNYSPKYYHNSQYPIDIHCCGELFVVLDKFKMSDSQDILAAGVLNWTIKNMQHPTKGYFYFQKWKLFTNKASLMRWNNAFMFNALSHYIHAKVNKI